MSEPVVPSEIDGEVITFYSFKGGTGRSMVLANAACIIARSGKSVLMLDWDLEAPGLHRYFRDQLLRHGGSGAASDAQIDEHLGLLDLFVELRGRVASAPEDEQENEDFVDAMLEGFDFGRYVMKTRIQGLSLMKAGAFVADSLGDYSARVNSFSWEALYKKAPSLMMRVAEKLSATYDYVLIDSRTGHTDVGGVCTMLMPEKLVLVFTPNMQSISGAIDVAQRAYSYRRRSDDGRPLSIFPLVSRVEASEPDLRTLWRKGDGDRTAGYQPLFERFFSETYGLSEGKGVDLSGYFSEVQIQQVPKYAYGERIAVLVEDASDRLSLARSYEAFVQRLLSLKGPWQEAPVADGGLTSVQQPERPPLRKRFSDLAAVFGVVVFIGLVIWGAVDRVTRPSADELEAKSIALSAELKEARSDADDAKAKAEQIDQERTKLRDDLARYEASADLLLNIDAVLDELGQLSFVGKAPDAVRESSTQLDEIRVRLVELQSSLEEALKRPWLDQVSVLLYEASDRIREVLENELPELERQRDVAVKIVGAMPPVGASTPRDRARAKWNQGYDAFLKGDYGVSRAKYEEAVQVDPSYAPAYNSLARLDLMKGEVLVAKQRLEQALVYEPKYVPAITNLAVTHLKLAERSSGAVRASEVAQAEKLAKRALELDSKYKSATRALLLVQNVKDEKETQQHIMQQMGPAP